MIISPFFMSEQHEVQLNAFFYNCHCIIIIFLLVEGRGEGDRV